MQRLLDKAGVTEMVGKQDYRVGMYAGEYSRRSFLIIHTDTFRQALIDFEGWRRWRIADQPEQKAAEKARLAVQNSSAANAKSIANRLKIAPSKPRSNTTSGDEREATQATTQKGLDAASTVG
jgi:hypothetical protein